MILRKLLHVGPLLFVAALAAVLALSFVGPFTTDGQAVEAPQSLVEPAIPEDPGVPEAVRPPPIQPLAADTVCRGSIGATTVPGKLVVPERATCTLTNTTILGNVEVKTGAVLSARGISVGGDVVSNGATSVAISASSTRRSLIQGSAQLAKGRTVSITDTTSEGGLEILENTNRLSGADVVVVRVRVNASPEISKNTGGVTFNSNRIDENAEISENAGGTSVQSNTIGDNLTISKNNGGTTVRSNRAGDNIDCVDNVPPPTGGGNVAGTDGNGSKTGQCARL